MRINKNHHQDKICGTCGTYYPFDYSNDLCPICCDDRQYLPEEGQIWTSYKQIAEKHSVHIQEIAEKLYEITIIPSFAIGQRAFLAITDQGNILWDCIPLLNELLISFIHDIGGLKAIAISHPHFYSNMSHWAEEFNCPIYIHESDEKWVFSERNRVRLWNGEEEEIIKGVNLVNIGGHFPGSSILHLAQYSEKGLVLCGDTFYISRSKKHISALYSYPNHIPLPVGELKRIKARIKSLQFDRIIGAFDYQSIDENAEKVLMDSFSGMTAGE